MIYFESRIAYLATKGKLSDNQEKDLDDWMLYGPGDPEIFSAVSRLALERGLKISEINALILYTLRQRLAEPDGDGHVS